jgi:hypothetical protein
MSCICAKTGQEARMGMQTLDQLVEKEVAKSGATRMSVRAAIERYAIQCEQVAQSADSPLPRKKEFRALAARAGRFLYYTRHYAPAGIFTEEDNRLSELSMRLPKQ